MHFRPQHALSSLHTFNLLDLIAQTPGGFILVKQGKRCQDSQRETFSTPRTTDSFVVSLGLFCVCLEEQRICGEQRLTIQCKAADGLCDLIQKGTWRTAGWWRIIRLSWFTANSSVTDALCWQPNNPHGHGDDTLIIMVDGWWLLLVLMVRPTLEGLLSLQEQTDAAQLSVVLDLFCLKREGCDGTLRWKAVLEYVRMISSLTLHFRSHFKERHEIMSKNSWVQFEKVKEDESLSHRSRRCWTRTHKLNSDWSMLSLNTVHTTTLSWS